MSYTGIYEVWQMMAMAEGKFVMKNIDEIIEAQDDEDEKRSYQKMKSMRIQIFDDNTSKSLMKVPEGITEEQLAEAIEEEGLVIEDGYIVEPGPVIKEYNGELYMCDPDDDLSTVGENGEDLHSFKKVSFDEAEGTLTMFTTVYRRVAE